MRDQIAARAFILLTATDALYDDIANQLSSAMVPYKIVDASTLDNQDSNPAFIIDFDDLAMAYELAKGTGLNTLVEVDSNKFGTAVVFDPKTGIASRTAWGQLGTVCRFQLTAGQSYLDNGDTLYAFK